MTAGVDTDKNDIIIDTPPILKIFIGQPLSNLKSWLKKKGNITIERIH